MVYLSNIFHNVQKTTRKYLRRKFLDSLRLHVTGGSGGMGLPKYGGIGGKGGDVKVIGKENLSLMDTLKSCKVKRIKAFNGEDSHRNAIIGATGEDVSLEVPVGISVFLQDGTKIGEINKEDEIITIARGGVGGKKETDYSGRRGESHTVILDLKIIADIGFVGFPNAGKSTLLSLISNAKPKIASYPFTTIHPNIGIIQYPDLRTVTAADLPGLVEGSHMNFGMGHKFLKHVERTKILLVVVDVSGFKLSHKYKSRSSLETIILLNKELELYREDLLDKPAILVVNKMDKKNAQSTFNDLKSALEDYESVLNDVPKELRPLKTLSFEKILSMTAKRADTEEIELLKCTLREVLDLTEEVNTEDELNLIDTLESSQRIRGPLLV